MLARYCRITLVSDAYEAEGAVRGMIGYVIEVHGGGAAFEVEFSDPKTGENLASIVAAEHELVETPE